MNNPRPRYAKVQWLGAILIAVLANFALLVKVVRLRAVPGSRDDFAWIFMAGRNWLAGHSPYDLGSLAQSRVVQDWGGTPPLFWSDGERLLPFVYPAHWSVFAVPAALLPWRVAALLWDIVNFGSFMAIFAVCWQLTMKRRPELSKPLLLSSLGLCALAGGTRWTFGDSQMDLLPLLGVAGAFWACQVRSTPWLAFFVFIAALKPQIGICPIVYLFLRNGRAGVALGMLAVIAVSVVAQLPSGLSVLPAQFGQSMHAHAALDFNAPATFDDAAALLGLVLPDRWAMLASCSLGLACTAALALLKRFSVNEPAMDPLWQLGLLSAVGVTFFPQHGYGFVGFMPVIVLGLQFRPRWLAVAVVAAAVLSGRIRSGESFGVRPLLASLTCLAVCVGCIVAFDRSIRASQQKRAAAA